MKVGAIALAVALALSFPTLASEPPADATETILAIRLDGKEVIETTLVKQSADGNVWLDVEQWMTLEGVELDLAGRIGLVSARELGLEPEFDEAAQAVNLRVPAHLRPDQALGSKRKRVTRTNAQPKGVLVNYDLSGVAHESGAYGLSLGHEARFGVGPATAITTGQLNHTPRGTTYKRGQTTVHYDHLASGRSVQIGDVFTPRTALGGTVNLAGVRVASDRSLRPDENFQPVPMLGGIAQTESTAEIFVNGDRSMHHAVKPGPWHVNQYPVTPGTNAVRVLVRDDFGREQVIEEKFYFSPSHLPKGTSEWEVTAGVIRQRGDSYSTPAIAARFDRGMSDVWTVGARVEASPDGQNIGLTNRLTLGAAGAVTVDAAASHADTDSGHALAVSYDYRTPNWGINAGHTRYSDDYWTLASSTNPPGLDGKRIASTSALALTLNPKGRPWSASVGAVSLEYVNGFKRQRVDASARYRTRSDEFGLGVSYFPQERDTHFQASWRHTFGSNVSMSATARKAPDIESEARLSGTTELAGREVRWAGGVVHNGKGESAWGQASMGTSKGALAVSGQYSPGNSHANARFQGSVWVGEGGVALQGASQSSFVVVEVEGQKGVPVSAGSGYLHKTNGRGVAVIPNVQPLVVHQVSVDGENLPLDVGLETTIQPAVVPRRGGAKVDFKVLSESMQELRIRRNGSPVEPPASLTSSTEEGLVGVGGVVVLMKPQGGQVLTVEDEKGARCLVQLPNKLPGYEVILDLECMEAP